jgi:DNA (cytosine-5)-methyltransferase 1
MRGRGSRTRRGPAAADPGHRLLAERPRTAGGRPGNGHQSGQGLDVAATALTSAPQAGTSPAAWAEYEPAIRRWESLLGFPAPPPAEPGPSGRPRLSAPFAEWMMGLSLGSGRC